MIQIFWINAIVGHTGPTVINDEGMGYPLDDDDLCFISCIAHNTHTQHLESIASTRIVAKGWRRDHCIARAVFCFLYS